MRHVVLVSLLIVPAALAQTPPGLLPPTITGSGNAPPTVVPAAAATPAKDITPIARYQNLAAFPPETVQALDSFKAAADWLARMQQPHGRFFPGLRPAVRLPVDGDTEFRQAMAAWGVCAAARFTGDAKLTAFGGQAVLALLTQSPETVSGCNKVGFAAALALAAFEAGANDPRLTAEAEKLCNFLVKRVEPTGAIACDEPETTTPYPGLAVQALAVSARTNPERKEIVAKCLAYYRTAFRTSPHPTLAGTMIPAAVELFVQSRDRDAASTAVEMADWLVTAQIGKDARLRFWAGGFRTGVEGSEPTADSAHAVRGLAAACQLARQIPDVARYTRYRNATIESLGYLRGLQYTADSTDHFDPKFRSHYLIGGLRATPTDGTVRPDATALGALAGMRFLASGADGRD